MFWNVRASPILARAGVDDRVEVIVGAALDTLPTLAGREEPFDLIFIDADKENNVAYVEWAIKLGAPGSIIVVDNIARSGRVLDPAPEGRPDILGRRACSELPSRCRAVRLR